MDTVSICMTYMTTACGILWFNGKRKSISKFLIIVNEKSLAILKCENGSLKWRKQRNRIQFFSIGLFITMLTMGILGFISLCVLFFVYGRAPLHVFNDSSRLSVNCQIVFQLVTILWIIIHFPLYFTFVIEIFLRISLNFNILADNLRNIGNWNEVNRVEINYMRFKAEMKEFGELKSVMEDLNGVFSSYIAAWAALTINTTGIQVANMAKSESLGEAVLSLPLPLWLISILASFCILGQKVTDSVSNTVLMGA